VDISKPAMRVTYKLDEIGEPTLESILRARGIIGAAEPALT
jgi:hypothetical protein